MDPYYYSTSVSSDFSTALSILMLYLAIFLVAAAIGIAGYILQGIGMYRMAKKQNIPNGWMAFVPYARSYLRGELSGSIKAGKFTMKKPGIWLIVVPVVFYTLFFIFYFAMIFGTILNIAINEHNPEAVLSMLLPLIVGIVIFVLLATAGSTAIYLLNAIVNYQIHRKYRDESLSLLHMVLGLFIPLYQPIYFYILGKDKNQLLQPLACHCCTPPENMLPPQE